MNTQDSQSELEFWEGMFGKSTNAKGNAEGYITYADFTDRLEAYVTTRVKEAVDNYHNEITANETKVWISRTDFEQRLKDAERLARIEESKLWYNDWGNGSEEQTIGDGSWEDYYDYRIEALTTTTNGKEE